MNPRFVFAAGVAVGAVLMGLLSRFGGVDEDLDYDAEDLAEEIDEVLDYDPGAEGDDQDEDVWA